MAPGEGTPHASPLAERRVILGVSGGIAAYKAAELARRLQERGARVVTILTAGAARFVTPLTFAALTHEPVYTADDLWTPRRGVEHVRLADEADLVIVAPATAHLLGQLAAGMAGDFLTTVILATGLRVPVLLAPAMNSHMWAHPAVQANVARLRAWGYRVMDPEHGPLAEGYAGVGRMPEPAAIVARAEALLAARRDLEGRTVLVTAGPTREPLDPIRFLSNRSSGKMGFALAEAARDRGARVVLVTGPVHLPDPAGVQVIRVETAAQMLEAVLRHAPAADAVIKAAAVADFRPARPAAHKIKKEAGAPVVELEPTPDILKELGRRKAPGQVLVGFAAETQDLLENAHRKIREKNLDLIVLNDVTQPGAGFEVDTNIVTLVYRDGRHEALPPMPKRQVADAILDRLPWPRVRREADAGDRTGTEAGEPSRDGERRDAAAGRGAAPSAPPMAKPRGAGGGTARGGAGS
ncbi:MAG: bifunctional phosphopantothenoylcysteine decarboxylase/phosphopantothenate--cysteine ligase CoaBC [Bacillota bacterium]|nr:MAG: bifunctional phosphopantothenoylcysteine decarboxylase/phosphopantothenate--cysteine ligase CoaBC [Bacillota bacterium]